MSKVDNKELIRMAAEVGAKVAVDRLDKERAKAQTEKKDKRLHNTKLLLDNFRLFKRYTENAVYDAEQLDESIYDILDMMERNSGSCIVDSIKNSVARTATLVGHVEAMLGLYRTYCEASNKPEDNRRWRVVQWRYIDDYEKSIFEIAEQEGVSTRTIDRDVFTACDHLAALFFGIDGVCKQ